MNSKLRMSNNLGARFKKTQLDHLNEDSINSIEILDRSNNNPDSTVLATCSDVDITLYNLSSQTKHTLYPLAKATKAGGKSSKSNEDDEISCLKSNNDLLFASNGRQIMLFDLNEQPRLVDKFKFNQETINCMEFGSGSSTLTIGDDSGEIKIVDMREAKSTRSSNNVSLTLRTTLKGHKNICYCLKYHPTRPHELFSGSYDCSFIKWDLRSPKAKLAG